MAKRKQESIYASILKYINTLDENIKIAILTHPTPDPDALGSARALQWILNKLGHNADIIMSGDVSHPQNKTIINILNLSLKQLDESNLEEYNCYLIVDSTENNINCKIKPNVVIDHHRSTSEAQIQIIDTIGSTSTIITELLQETQFTFEEEKDQDVATALLMGIKTDTLELTSETTVDRDFEAIKFLTEFINRKKLANIINYTIPNYYFELEKELNKQIEGVFVNHRIDGPCYVGCIGTISPVKKDSIPMLADKFVRMEGIETTVIFAIINDKIVSSIRSKNPSLDVNIFAQTIFGKEYAGGKLGSAGAAVPLGALSTNSLPNELKEKTYEIIKEILFHKVIHIITGN